MFHSGTRVTSFRIAFASLTLLTALGIGYSGRPAAASASEKPDIRVEIDMFLHPNYPDPFCPIQADFGGDVIIKNWPEGLKREITYHWEHKLSSGLYHVGPSKVAAVPTPLVIVGATANPAGIYGTPMVLEPLPGHTPEPPSPTPAPTAKPYVDNELQPEIESIGYVIKQPQTMDIRLVVTKPFRAVGDTGPTLIRCR